MRKEENNYFRWAKLTNLLNICNEINFYLNVLHVIIIIMLACLCIYIISFWGKKKKKKC